MEILKIAGTTGKSPRVRVRGYEKPREVLRRRKKVEARYGRRECGNNFGVIFQGPLFLKKIRGHFFWGGGNFEEKNLGSGLLS